MTKPDCSPTEKKQGLFQPARGLFSSPPGGADRPETAIAAPDLLGQSRVRQRPYGPKIQQDKIQQD
jgi:hypothetical protein